MSDEEKMSKQWMPVDEGDSRSKYRLCELVEIDRPRPDWFIAPPWANWWAVDATCLAMWYEFEPICYETITYVGWGPKMLYGVEQGMKLGAGGFEIPIGVDWRTLIEKRPEAPDAT